MRTIPILFTFDSNLVTAAGVCLTSLLQNAGQDTFYDIFILHKPDPRITDGKLADLANHFSNCRITFRDVIGEFENGFNIRGIPETAYFRLLSPELIPEYDRIIYSDVDVIFREDLSKYYDIDLGDNYFAGVDSLPAINDDDLEYAQKTLGNKIGNGYYYSGNLIINLKRLRQDNKTKEFRSLGGRHFKFQDMDIINLACSGRFLPLGPSFCLSTYYYDSIMSGRESVKAAFSKEELEHALRSGIVHYNGAKPWKEVCPNMDIWWAYYRRSIFYDEEFTHRFWKDQTYRLEKMSLMKRIKLVGRYFRKGGRM